MKCPYCGRQIRKEMPDHLAANRQTCGVAHGKKLLGDLDVVMKQHAARLEEDRPAAARRMS